MKTVQMKIKSAVHIARNATHCEWLRESHETFVWTDKHIMTTKHNGTEAALYMAVGCYSTNNSNFWLYSPRQPKQYARGLGLDDL